MKYNYEFSDKRKEKKKKIIFICVIVVIALLISSFFFKNSNNMIVKGSATIILAPLKFIQTTAVGTYTNVSNYFGDISKVNSENLVLKEKVNELELKLLETKAIEDENTSLKNMLSISNDYKHFVLRSGRIIMREHDNFSQTFVINVGLNDGVKLNQAVIHKNGLVGYISSVTDITSTVTTVLDPRVSVSVTISTVNEPAILKGNVELKANNLLKLEYIPISASISIGDMLYTSGLGEMFPKSLPVAKVIKIENNKNDTDRYAIAEPAVDIKTISEVSVIIN